MEVTLSLATPFAAAMLGEWLGISPIAVLIPAALTVSWRSVDRATGRSILSPESRLLECDMWRLADALLAGALFFLMGRALPEALAGADALPWATLALVALALLALTWVVQFALSFLTIAAPGAPAVPRRDGGRVAPWRAAAVLACGAGRNVVALAIVLALPATLPDGRPWPPREAVVAVIAVMVVLAGLLQWALLPRIVAWARLGGAEETEREKALAARAVAAEMPAEAPESGAEAGERRLLRLRERDAIGDGPLREAQEAVALRARAARVEAEADSLAKTVRRST